MVANNTCSKKPRYRHTLSRSKDRRKKTWVTRYCRSAELFQLISVTTCCAVIRLHIESSLSD